MPPHLSLIPLCRLSFLVQERIYHADIGHRAGDLPLRRCSVCVFHNVNTCPAHWSSNCLSLGNETKSHSMCTMLCETNSNSNMMMTAHAELLQLSIVSRARPAAWLLHTTRCCIPSNAALNQGRSGHSRSCCFRRCLLLLLLAPAAAEAPLLLHASEKWPWSRGREGRWM